MPKLTENWIQIVRKYSEDHMANMYLGLLAKRR